MTRIAIAASVVVGAALLTAAPAGAAPAIVVLPNQSIQAAIDSAGNGATIIVKPGVYEENLTIIGKKNLTIKGPGAQLRPGPETEPTPCDDIGEDAAAAKNAVTTQDATPISGICIGSPDPSNPIRGITVDGFDIRNFTGEGIIIFGGYHTDILRNTLVNDGGYGVFALMSSDTRIDSNRAEGNAEAGFYVGDSPRANATVVNNESSNNQFGVFLRDSQHGTVKDNNLHDNCVGVMVLADAPGPAGSYHVTFNNIAHNNKVCDSDEVPFPFSGSGIVLWGAHDMNVHSNNINQNVPATESCLTASQCLTTADAAPFGGGISVIQGLGGTPPTNNRVTRNSLFENEPDILWDGSGTRNVLSPNTCAVSVPSGFCSL